MCVLFLAQHFKDVNKHISILTNGLLGFI